ncbi:MAG: 50S ribosomal protein L6 [Candidatus Liptonbacteria bacterium]|nr:50S ribosomal protein L6 [Candidatus Liptonbacteria bacterium]
MSRLARKPISVPPGITVTEQADRLQVRGPKGEITAPILPGLAIAQDSTGIMVRVVADSRQARANVGTSWSLIQNAIRGVNEGFKKVLDVQGVGFRAVVEGKDLVLYLGYVNPVRYPIPEGVSITVEKNLITINGVDLQLVGQAAAQIRAFKKPEPYKGKGIRYQGEVITLKAGKKAATGGAK